MISESFFGKKHGIALGIFQNFGVFLKWPYLEKLKSESAQTCYTAKGHQYVSENVIKIWGDFGVIFWKKPWAKEHKKFKKTR